MISSWTRLRLQTGCLEKLSLPKVHRMGPAISAKGDKLAYSLLSHGHTEIWRKDLWQPEAAGGKLISSTYE